MTDLQECLLSIYLEFKRICDCLGLKFYAAYGTMLGAARHGGFIPWDDDIDVFMFRDDLNKLIRLGPKIIQNDYFIQSNETDPYWFNQLVKIRKNKTTAIEKGYENLNTHQGLWIDIFPLDYRPNQKTIDKIYKKKSLLIRRVRMAYNFKYTFKGYLLNTIAVFLYPSKKYAYKKLLNLATKYNGIKSDKFYTICNIDSHSYLDLDDTKECLIMPFENTTMPVWKNYDKILTKKYGNWRQEPPPDERKDGSFHSIVKLDLTKDYTEYKHVKESKK